MEPVTSLPAYLRLIEAVTRGEAFASVCQAALDCVELALGVRRAAILTLDAHGVMRFAAWRQLSPGYRARVEGHSPWPDDARDPRPVLVAEVAADPSLGPLREVVLAEGIRALAFVPLVARGQLLGKLVLYGETPEICAEERVQRAALVADHIALVLDHHRTHERVRELNELLVAFIETMPEAIAFVDAEGVMRFANHRLQPLWGLGGGPPAGRPAAEVAREIADRIEDGDEVLRQWNAAVELRRPLVREVRLLDGRTIEVAAAPVTARGAYRGRLVQYRDVTERRRSEAQVLQSRKMESIGRLAGGVAHDFNNMLTAMMGYMDLVAVSLPPGSEEHGYLAQALEAAEQAAALTSQLLAFARRQPGKPTPQKLDDLLVRMTPLVRRLVPESVDLVTHPGAHGVWVMADPGELEQVLLNLVFNARDAMPDGGLLELSTAEVERGGTGGAGLVALEVADSGVGIDAEAMKHLFEPFYTTKTDGHGTGLGLATVYGVVQQWGGHVEVESRPGQGARFRVLLPRIEAPAAAGASATAGPAPGGSETVLVVEDDDSVRGLVSAMLARLGYVVLAAEHPDEALAQLERHAGRVDLLIADMVMPGMSGRELASRAQAMHPTLRVLLTSGYAQGQALEGGAGFAFMPKPFSIDTLARRVRAVLGSPAGEPS